MYISVSMQRISFMLFIALVVSPDMPGHGLRAAEPIFSSTSYAVEGVDSASSAPVPTVTDTLGGRWRFGGRVELLYKVTGGSPVIDTDTAIAFANLYWTRFRRAGVPLGITAELGIQVIKARTLLATVPYASFGPVLRLGDFSLDGQVGAILVVPFVSASAAYSIPLGTSVDLRLRAAGLIAIVGGDRPDFCVGGGLSFH